MDAAYNDEASAGGLASEIAQAHAAEGLLVDRLARCLGGPIRVALAPMADIEGVLLRVGRDHIWVADQPGLWLLSLDHVDALYGYEERIPRAEASAPQSRIQRPGFGSALREALTTGRPVSLLVGNRWFRVQRASVGREFVQEGDVSLPMARIRACRVWH